MKSKCSNHKTKFRAKA